MKLQISLFFLILNGLILYGQDKTSTTSRYQKYPESGLDREKLLARALEQKQLDYWEYWFVSSKNQDIYLLDDTLQRGKEIYVREIRMNGGTNRTKNNSQLINQMNPSSGFWNNPPGPDTYNLACIYKNRKVLVTSEDSLIELLKPIETIEQALLFAYLNDYSLDNIRYRSNAEGDIELIIQSNQPDRFIKKKSNVIIWVYSIFHLKLNEKGIISKTKIGNRKYKLDGYPVLP